MNTFPWFANYPEGVPNEIDADKYSSILDLLDTKFEVFKDHPAFVNMDKVLTYGEVDRLSNDFAAYLQNVVGLNVGDRIAIQMPNLLQFPIAMFGALRAGLVVVNTNPLYTPREMKHQFNDSGAVAIVILANFASNLQEILSETTIKSVIVTQIGDQLGGLKKGIVNFVVRKIKKMVPAYSLPGHIKYSDALKEGANHNLSKPQISNSNPAFLQYTGGTTGVSKGATLSHRNIVANLLQSREWFVGTKETEEVVITALPLYHIFALTVNCLVMIDLGAFNVLITNPRDMPAFLKELKKYKFTIMTGVNTLFNGLMNQPKFKDLDFSKVKFGLGGGMAMQKNVSEKWKKITKAPLVEGYGLSETSPILTANPLDGNDRIGSIGMPLSSTDVKIMNEDGKEIPIGERGEICARGPQVMSGYWQREKETDDAFHGEFFRTGDIGIMEEDGFFTIVDRIKDMILVSGFNVYPNEIENVVADHEKVSEVAAIGVPDEKSNEAVKIFVVKKDPSLTENELMEYCKSNFTGYKRPKHIEFRDDLPKSNVGKILRRHLREE